MEAVEINELVQLIIFSPNSELYVAQLLDEPDCCDFFFGTLSEDNARLLIQQSHINKKLAPLLPVFFLFSNIHTISYAVFELIKNYPHAKIRKDILISLAHCKISFYQLYYISTQKICFEAFASLLDVYMKETCFSVVDLTLLLMDNIKFANSIDWASILEYTGYDEEKKDIVRKYLLEN